VICSGFWFQAARRLGKAEPTSRLGAHPARRGFDPSSVFSSRCTKLPCEAYPVRHGGLSTSNGPAPVRGGIPLRDGADHHHPAPAPRTPRLTGRKSLPRPPQSMRCEMIRTLLVQGADGLHRRVQHGRLSHLKERHFRCGWQSF
jgi:hypothetical protein